MTSVEIHEAMRDRAPVTYEGLEYERIEDYICSYKDGKMLTHCALIDRCGHSIRVVPAGKVGRKRDEEGDGVEKPAPD